jgi:hypothetical protein
MQELKRKVEDLEAQVHLRTTRRGSQCSTARIGGAARIYGEAQHNNRNYGKGSESTTSTSERPLVSEGLCVHDGQRNGSICIHNGACQSDLEGCVDRCGFEYCEVSVEGVPLLTRQRRPHMYSFQCD